MAFKILVSTIRTIPANKPVADHILRRTDDLHLEGILGNCHLFHVGFKGGAA